VDWQALYNESEGRVLTDMMAFDINDGNDAGNKAQLLCKLLNVPKAFTAQVLRAAASAHGLMTLDSCRQIMCSTFQKLLEREALLQHISIKQAAGACHRLPPPPDLCVFQQALAGAPTYADIVNLGRVSAVVAVKLKELRRSMFWIGHNKFARFCIRALFLSVLSHAAGADALCGASKIMKRKWRTTWKKCSSDSDALRAPFINGCDVHSKECMFDQVSVKHTGPLIAMARRAAKPHVVTPHKPRTT
jgi:hypothetical protein